MQSPHLTNPRLSENVVQHAYSCSTNGRASDPLVPQPDLPDGLRWPDCYVETVEVDGVEEEVEILHPEGCAVADWCIYCGCLHVRPDGRTHYWVLPDGRRSNRSPVCVLRPRGNNRLRLPEPPEEAEDHKGVGWVYFIRPKSRTSIVKIGWAKDPLKRLSALQIGHDDELEVAAKMPGDLRMEQALHRVFAHARLRGEWFTVTDSIRSLVGELQEAHAAR